MNLHDAEGYILIYDFLNESPRLLFPLIFIGFAVFGFYFVKSSLKTQVNNEKDMVGISNGSKNGCGGLIFILIGLTLSIWSLNLPDYFKTRKICKNNELRITIGYVTDLSIINGGKNNSMTFAIENQRFTFGTRDFRYYGCTYGDLEDTNIKDSTFLKIHYFVKDGRNIIVRVQAK